MLECLKLNFCRNRNDTFPLRNVYQKSSENSCSVPIKNIINHMATLPTGLIGYIEITTPITTVEQLLYRINDLTTLVRSVVHTNHLGAAEQTIVHYHGMTETKISCEVNQLICIKVQSSTILSVLYNRLKK